LWHCKTRFGDQIRLSDMKHSFTPVFIIGSARSGTTLLARVLFSHPDFFPYRAESLVMNVCKFKYGDIFNSNKKKTLFLNDWFRARQFLRSGLTRNEFISILENSSTFEELLIKFLEKMTVKNDKRFIVDSTPSNAKFISKLNKESESAIYLAITRDGRDVAISLNKLGWTNPPYPFRSEEDRLHYAVTQWVVTQKIIQRAQKRYNIIPIRYEDLVTNPEDCIKTVAEALGVSSHDFDLGVINDKTDANSAFGKLSDEGRDPPSNRWKRMDKGTSVRIAYGANRTLRQYGYEIETCNFSPKLLARYCIFRLHIMLKKYALLIPGMGEKISSSLEINID